MPEVKCAYDKLIKTAKLVPNPRNPNKHPQSQLDLLAKIIDAQGWRNPIVTSNRSGFIIKGHARLEVAIQNGWDTCPVDFQDYETEAEEWADMIADNRIAELAEMDMPELKDLLQELDTGAFDMDLTGFDNKAIEDLLTQFHMPNEGLTDDDAIPEDVEPICKYGDLCQLGDHRLLCGDATVKEDVEKLMDGKKADMVFTDPPYGIAYQDVKGRHSKIANDNGVDVANLLRNVLLDCPMYICCNWQSYPRFYYIVNGIKSCIIWDKETPIQHLDKFFKQHEFILYTEPFGGEPTIDGDVWRISRETSKNHPTAKPVELICRAIGHSSLANNIILDLFLGSGSTLIACEKLNRRCYGMEIEPKYCDVIIKRWEDYTGKKADLLPILRGSDA